MPQLTKPTVVYHADWGSNEKKRWCAKATLCTEGHYTAFAPEPVGNPSSLIEQLGKEAGEAGCAIAGFDFTIVVPEFYAKRAGIPNLAIKRLKNWANLGGSSPRDKILRQRIKAALTGAASTSRT